MIGDRVPGMPCPDADGTEFPTTARTTAMILVREESSRKTTQPVTDPGGHTQPAP